ncbi:thioredoxin family protein [Thalassoglobus neptunius]|uniref:thioredoxin family protein n=1 Tax=Thalassoglobus neptunius TaxID=1938619 RepID=UPI0036F37448
MPTGALRVSPWTRKLARLKSRYSGKLHVVKINVDEKPHLAKHYGVSGIPRVFLFDHGRVKRSRTGYASQEELSEWVSPYL